MINIHNIKTKIDDHYKIVVVSFFVILFSVGLNIYKDYGVSWDEIYQWKDNGLVAYNYVVHHDKEALLNGNEKYHGPAFELLLVTIEKEFDLTDTRDVYFMRHFVTFVTFFISVIFFYLLSFRCFKSWRLALVGCLFYVLSPRIFAEAFYNSKDIPFLSFFIIGMYTLLLFYEKRTYVMAALYALVCAIAIDIRIMGILLPMMSITLVGIEIICYFLYKTKPTTKIGSFLCYLIFLMLFVILFWPVLWEGPVFHFTEAFKEMSLYHWSASVLYLGNSIKATSLPWHYLPVWMGITTPVLYLVLFVTGVFVLLKSIVTNFPDFLQNRKPDIIILFCFFLPLVAIMILHSVVYDAWRHVYFIYGAFVLIVLHGLRFLYSRFKMIKMVKLLFVFILIFSVMDTLYSMIAMHPYQNVYFNCIAGKDMKTIKDNFEMDYWGLSARKGLEYILKTDTSKKITIYAENFPEIYNSQILPINQRQRLAYITKKDGADYYVGYYRWHKEDYDYKKEVFSIYQGNAKILSVFKFRKSQQLVDEVKGDTILKFANDFENENSTWAKVNTLQPVSGAHSGKRVAVIDSTVQYGVGLKIPDVKSIYDNHNVVVKTSFWKYDIDAEPEASYILSIESKAGGEPQFWHTMLKTNSAPKKNIGEWIKMEAAVELPKLNSPDDIIKIYLWNPNKKRMYIDDISIVFITEKE